MYNSGPDDIAAYMKRRKEYACIQYPVNGVLRNCVQWQVWKAYDPPRNYKPYRVIKGIDFELVMVNESKYYRKSIRNCPITEEHIELFQRYEDNLIIKWWNK